MPPVCEHLPMSSEDDPEARIRELERYAGGGHELGTRPPDPD